MSAEGHTCNRLPGKGCINSPRLHAYSASSRNAARSTQGKSGAAAPVPVLVLAGPPTWVSECGVSPRWILNMEARAGASGSGM